MGDFEKCVERTLTSNGLTYNINCRLGLWGVSGPSKSDCEIEALHYWQQYASDGEYSSIIGGPTVLEVLSGGCREV